MDEEARRDKMEASENTATPAGGGEHSLHRVDPDRVSMVLSAGAHDSGYARLNLMVSTIFDRLTAGEPRL